jgi:hypothetical protein
MRDGKEVAQVGPARFAQEKKQRTSGPARFAQEKKQRTSGLPDLRQEKQRKSGLPDLRKEKSSARRAWPICEKVEKRERRDYMMR